MKKNPEFTLKKTPKIIKKTDIQNVQKKSKPNLKSMLPVLAYKN